MKDIVEIGIEIGITVVIAIALYAILAALPVMLLWNWLAPDLFALKTISFWQALGLLVLCGALFGSKSSSSKK